MAKFDTLQSIFQMMSPLGAGGSFKNAFGSQDQAKQGITNSVLEEVFGKPGGGALSGRALIEKLKEITSKADEQTLKDFDKFLRVYVNADSNFNVYPPASTTKYHLMVQDMGNQKDDSQLSNFQQIIGGVDIASVGQQKDMAIILSDSDFLHPSVQNAQNAEIWLNFIPSIVMSRCVPYFSAEFSFDKQVVSGSPLNAPSLLKFLMGSPPAGSQLVGDDTPNGLMIKGNTIKSEPNAAIDRVKTIAGMEMFTSPQTLVDPNPMWNKNRYVNVQDPFRPFATIESCTLNVASSGAGLFSTKKATMVIKLHDKSRLAEIADLIRPQTFPDLTVWLTYGWRHPPDKDNPYAEFINKHMLTRDAFMVANSSFVFDNYGQVTINLELYTRGVWELRDLKLTDVNKSPEAVMREIEDITKKIKEFRIKAGIDPKLGINKEIRATQIIRAAERGEFPEFNNKELQEAIAELDKSFTTENGTPKAAAIEELKKQIKILFARPTNSEKYDYKERFHNNLTAGVDMLMTFLTPGYLNSVNAEGKTVPKLNLDPFLMYPLKSAERVKDLNVPEHPFANILTSATTQRKSPPKGQKAKDKPFKRSGYKGKYVSFGKLFSTFIAKFVATLSGIDDVQLYFYKMNERCGLASGTNIAEFPIDLNVFEPQLRDHISRSGTQQISIETFLQLVTKAQLEDVRGVGYGLNEYFDPYDPETKTRPITKGAAPELTTAQDQLFKGIGQFKKPVITFYIETMYEASGESASDALAQFDRAQLSTVSPQSVGQLFNKVMRIHVFDKQHNPYIMAEAMLRADNSPELPVLLASPKIQDALNAHRDKISKTTGIPPDILKLLKEDQDYGFVFENQGGNEKIKKFVSKLVPSIIHGINSTTITQASLSSKQDALLTAAQLTAGGAGRADVMRPSGASAGGLPLRIVPAAGSLTTMGCPLIRFGQIYFVDFNTGTTADNLYGVTGITHAFAPGKFETTMTLSFADAYGKFESKQSVADFLEKLPTDKIETET